MDKRLHNAIYFLSSRLIENNELLKHENPNLTEQEINKLKNDRLKAFSKRMMGLFDVFRNSPLKALPEYLAMPPEIMMLLFDLERAWGFTVGDGEIFKNTSSVREYVDVRYAFAYIANVNYGFSQKTVCDWIGIKQGLMHHAKTTVATNLEYNTMYRNRMFKIAVDNGIMDLVFKITEIADNGRKRKISSNLG